jgi:hypothetical protein
LQDQNGALRRSVIVDCNIPIANVLLPCLKMAVACFRLGSMGETSNCLIEIQAEVIACRRLAAELSDPKSARRLYELADEIERRAREVDRDG